MAELRIHDQSSIYFKSIRTGTTTKDIDVKIPDKSGTLITDTTLQDILNRGGRFSASQILKPDITETPLEHPEAYSKLLPIASYKTSDTFVGEHTATEWVASEQPDFSTVLDSTSDSLFRDGWYPAVNRPSVPVYVKYRFISEDVCSPYSDALEFTTPTGGVKIPTLSVLEDGVTPTVKGSPFALYGDATGINHVSSSWEIYRVRDNKLIKSITQDSSKLTEYKIEAGLLDSDTEYKFVLTYHTDHPVFSRTRKALGIYKTPESSIKTPTLSFNSDNNKYLIIGTPFVVNSGTDEHKFTAWEVKNATDAVVYTEPNSRDLTTLNLTGVLEPDSSYTVTAVYKGAKASSAKAVLTFRTPVETIDNLNKKITLTRLSDGGVELKMDKVQLATAEKLLYLTWTVQNYEKKVALEVRLDKDLDTKYGQDLIYTMTPAESWLKWFPNLEAVNPTLKLSAKGRVVGEKTILNYSTSAPFEYKPKIELGEMSVAGHTESLTPLVSITAHSGEDLSWITVTNATWELWKLQEGLNPVKVKSVDSSDLLKNRYNGLDYNTNYRATVVYNTNFGKYSKSIEFKSADIFLPRPNVIVESKGNTILIKVNNPDRNIPGKPEKSHGSTTWILYSNTGDTLWKSEKNTTNLTEITLPTGLLQGTTNYKVGVIFHSRDGLLSSNEGQATYYHRGIEISDGFIVGDMGINKRSFGIDRFRPELSSFVVYEGGVPSTTEQIVSTKMTLNSETKKIAEANSIEELSYPRGTDINQCSALDFGANINIELRTTSGIEKLIPYYNTYLRLYPSPVRFNNVTNFFIKDYQYSVGLHVASHKGSENNLSGFYNVYDNGSKYSMLTRLYVGNDIEIEKLTISNEVSSGPTYLARIEANKVVDNNITYAPLFMAKNSGLTDNYLRCFSGPTDKLNRDTGWMGSLIDANMNFQLNGYNHFNIPLLDKFVNVLYNKTPDQSSHYGSFSVNRFLNFSFGNDNGLTFSNLVKNTNEEMLIINIFSPTECMWATVETEYTLNTTDTFRINNLDMYFYYFNNTYGLVYPVDGQLARIKFATKEELMVIAKDGIGGNHAAGMSEWLKQYGEVTLYYLQENVDLTQNVNAIRIKRISNNDIEISYVKVPITNCVLMFSVYRFNVSNGGDSNNNAYSDLRLSALKEVMFKKYFPNINLLGNFEFNNRLSITPNCTMSKPLKNYNDLEQFYVNSLFDSLMQKTYDSNLSLNYSWINNEGYLTTIPGEKFKSLSELRTSLGLSPTNSKINNNDLTEWYVFFWRDRIYFVPNTPIATIDEVNINKWKCLYKTSASKPTTELLSIDKVNDENKYKLVIPRKTNFAILRATPGKNKLNTPALSRYCKINRIATPGGELGDVIEEDYFNIAHHGYWQTIADKFRALANKVSDEKILPFFELQPSNVVVQNTTYTGVSVKIQSDNYLTLQFRIMLQNNTNKKITNKDDLPFKIDKIKFLFYGESIGVNDSLNGRYALIESNLIDTNLQNNNNDANFRIAILNDHFGRSNKVIIQYTTTISKTHKLFPKANTDAGFINPFESVSLVQAFVHITEPKDCVYYAIIQNPNELSKNKECGDILCINLQDMENKPQTLTTINSTIDSRLKTLKSITENVTQLDHNVRSNYTALKNAFPYLT